MVRYCHKVQGHAELVLHASGKNDRLASAEAVRGSRIVAVASDVGVQRIAGVNVKIAEVGVAQRVRRCTRRGLRNLLTMDWCLDGDDAKNGNKSNHHTSEIHR